MTDTHDQPPAADRETTPAGDDASKARPARVNAEAAPASSQPAPVSSQPAPPTSQLASVSSQRAPVASQPAPVSSETSPDSSAAVPVSSQAEEIAPSLAAMIASIRSALTPNASPQARSAGAMAAQSILTVLEAKPGQPLTTALPAPTRPLSPLATLLSQPSLNRLAAMSREELINLLKQVTGAVSPQTQSPASGAPRFHLIQIPRVGGRS